MKQKILGFVVSETAKGNIGTTIYFETEHDEYRKNNSRKCEGVACRSEYVNGDQSDKLKVGQYVTFVYVPGYQGKAVVQDIIPCEENLKH